MHTSMNLISKSGLLFIKIARIPRLKELWRHAQIVLLPVLFRGSANGVSVGSYKKKLDRKIKKLETDQEAADGAACV